jgi:hypothetical protein
LRGSISHWSKSSPSRREGEGYVRLSPAVLRFLSLLAGDPEWEQGFENMRAYAARTGWIDSANMVRAHIT